MKREEGRRIGGEKLAGKIHSISQNPKYLLEGEGRDATVGSGMLSGIDHKRREYLCLRGGSLLLYAEKNSAERKA